MPLGLRTAARVAEKPEIELAGLSVLLGFLSLPIASAVNYYATRLL